MFRLLPEIPQRSLFLNLKRSLIITRVVKQGCIQSTGEGALPFGDGDAQSLEYARQTRASIHQESKEMDKYQERLQKILLDSG